MKKLFLAVILSASMISASAMAFDIPTGSSTGDKVEKVGKTVTKKVATSAINKKVAKEACAFKDDKTTTVSATTMTCDLDKVIKYLKDWHDGLEATVASDVDVKVVASGKTEAIAKKRAQAIEKKLSAKLSYWDWSIGYVTTDKNKVSISLSVD